MASLFLTLQKNERFYSFPVFPFFTASATAYYGLIRPDACVRSQTRVRVCVRVCS